METGMRKKKGKIIPANHITELTIAINGVVMVNADIGSSISKNPYFQFKLPGVKGDTVVLSYTDNNGKTGTATAKSK